MRLIHLGAIAVLGLSLACGVPSDDGATFEDEADVPFGLLDSPTTTVPEDTGSQQPTAVATLCFLRDDLLTTVERRAPVDAELSDVIELLLAGPTTAERSAGISTAIGEDVVARQIDTSHGVAEIDLAEAFSDDSGHRQLRAVAQVVCTLTSRPGVGQVTFTLDGEPIDVPRGDGSTTSDPVARDDYRQLAEPDSARP